MSDAVLSLTTSLTSLLAKSATGDTTAAGTNPVAQPADPFAALFAAAAGGQPSPTMPIAPVAPVALPVAIALPSAAEAALPVITDESGTRDDTDPKDESKDPLGDAIASGAIAVLAMVPAMVPAVPAAQTTMPPPVAIASPITNQLTAITGAGTRAPAYKIMREPTVDKVEVATTDAGTSVATSPASAATAAVPVDLPERAEIEDAGGRRTPLKPSTDAKPAAAALSSETTKAIMAALVQSPPAATTIAVAVPVATAEEIVAPTPAAKAVGDDASSVAKVAQQQAVPASPPPAGRGGRDTIEPHGVGSDIRKRTNAIDGIPTGLSQHAEQTTPATFDDAATGVQSKGDTVVRQTLSVAKDGAWLDSLTRDIVASAGSGNALHFTLDPQNLGTLTVAISQSADGASIRMTADTDTTRNILLDAQPKLIAEARAQGLKVSDTQVDLSNQHQGSGQDASRWAQGNAGQNSATQNGQNRQSSAAHQPVASSSERPAGADIETLPSNSAALYA